MKYFLLVILLFVMCFAQGQIPKQKQSYPVKEQLLCKRWRLISEDRCYGCPPINYTDTVITIEFFPDYICKGNLVTCKSDSSGWRLNDDWLTIINRGCPKAAYMFRTFRGYNVLDLTDSTLFLRSGNNDMIYKKF